MSLTAQQVAKQVDEFGPIVVFLASGGALLPVPPASYGTFASGDSYVVLYTEKTSDGVKRKIYFWQGKESTIDEVGFSAVLARELDDALGGSPVQVRMVQGEEPEEFKQLFPNGLNFRHGGVASSFHHVTVTKAPPKLFIVKGKPTPQVVEVKPAASSLVSNASFLLDDDTSNTLYVWHGSESGLKEKRQALDTANAFRFNRGNLRFTVLDQYDTSSADAAAFFQVLGVTDVAGTAGAIQACEGLPEGAALNGSAGANGAAAGGTTEAAIYPLDGGSAVKPPTRKALDHTKQFLVMSGGRGWLWVGSKAGAPNVQAAQSIARAQGVAGEPEVVKDRLEPGLFISLIPDWGAAEYASFQESQAAVANAAGYGTGPMSPTAPAVDWAALADKMVQDSAAAVQAAGAQAATPASVAAPVNSKITVWIVVEHDLVEITGAELGHFFAGDAYVVLHEFTTNTGDERQVIYFWQGRLATNLEQGTAAVLATDLHNNKYKGTSALVRVAQQAEPPSLVLLFAGRMVVHRGDRPAEGLPQGGSSVAGPRLYQIKHDGSQAEHAVEVTLSAASLNSGDVFVLKDAAGNVTLWYGSGSDAQEAQLGAVAAAQLSAALPTQVKEGAEPAGFWEALGGHAEYPHEATRADARPPVFFDVRDAGRAGMGVEATTTFSQESLDPTNMSLLEAGNTVYVWCGRETAPTEKTHAHQLVDAYVAKLGRQVNVVDVDEGAEPPFFTQYFAGWDSTKRANLVDLAKLKFQN